MTSYDTCDISVEALKRLQSLAPDPSRADRVRLRCRAQLGRNRNRQVRAEVITGFARRVLVAVVVGGFCALYLTALVSMTFRLRGLLY